MQILNLPEYVFNIKERGDRFYIFDPYRSKFVLLTPEEQVRQHFARYLNEQFGYPVTLMMTEHSLELNRMKKRCDIIAFHRNGTPVLLAECKAPGVNITSAVFDQVSRYNIAFRVRYLLVTNGMKHYGCKVDFESGSVTFLDQIPDYESVISEVEESTRR